MDLNLFGRLHEPVTSVRFADWPEHIRREFALLVAERQAESPDVSDSMIRDLTGIAPDALVSARQPGRLHSLTYPVGESMEEDDEARRQRHRDAVNRARAKRRGAVDNRQHGRGGWKKRRPAGEGEGDA